MPTILSGCPDRASIGRLAWREQGGAGRRRTLNGQRFRPRGRWAGREQAQREIMRKGNGKPSGMTALGLVYERDKHAKREISDDLLQFRWNIHSLGT